MDRRKMMMGGTTFCWRALLRLAPREPMTTRPSILAAVIALIAGQPAWLAWQRVWTKGAARSALTCASTALTSAEHVMRLLPGRDRWLVP